MAKDPATGTRQRHYTVATPGRKEGSVGPTEAEVPFEHIEEGTGSHLPLARPQTPTRRKGPSSHGDA